MSTITRREFMRLAGAAVALAGVGVAGRSRGGAVPARILVIGGGYAGAIAARYTKAHVPDAEVTLVERDETYVSCPFSNEVLSGERDLASLSFGYAALGKAGVSVVTDEVIELDPVARTATTRGGKRFASDFLVVAPGIAFRWDAIPGYDEAASALVPHAWKAGPQTLLLKSQIEAMPDGGLLVIVPPPTPYRCPPGPYERAAQIAHFLTRHGKSKSKVLILDPKDAFSKEHLFLDGWKHHYGDMIEWVPGAAGGKVESIDPKSRVVRAEFDEFTPDVLNVVPPQKAGPIAEQSGLTDDRGWCPVAPASFESTRAKGVYVAGRRLARHAPPRGRLRPQRVREHHVGDFRLIAPIGAAGETAGAGPAAALEKAVARRPATPPNAPLTGSFSGVSQVGRLRAEDAELRQQIQSLGGTSRLDIEICRGRVPETPARARRRWH